VPERDELYTVARTVLLDALEALGEHRKALVLVGAQAIYLRVGEADLAVETPLRPENPRSPVPFLQHGKQYPGGATGGNCSPPHREGMMESRLGGRIGLA
jgi:hypothetical protein